MIGTKNDAALVAPKMSPSLAPEDGQIRAVRKLRFFSERDAPRNPGVVTIGLPCRDGRTRRNLDAGGNDGEKALLKNLVLFLKRRPSQHGSPNC
jgi:hypothetical protein